MKGKLHGLSIDIDTVNTRNSFKSRFGSDESILLESFSIKSLSTESPFKVQLEKLINYISSHANDLLDKSTALHDLERLVANVLDTESEPSLLRLLKEFGWTGTGFDLASDDALDGRELLQAFSNLYLKFRNIQSTLQKHLENTISGVEQVLPFCPDILFEFLAEHSQESTNNIEGTGTGRSLDEVPCLSFSGACMLVDISGFSKFSGAMCSKGVTGLDELRKATNGFLGHFVKTVYEYNGDGECSV